jgi:hypothetical protein
MCAESLSRRRLRGAARRAALVAPALATVALAFNVCRADAVIMPAVPIDGPSEDIVGFGGVAMAEDGTGGVVYLKRVGGVAHVFVSRYVGGRFLAPIRVDTEEPFAASQPRIGAGEGGELVVVWTTPFATEKEKPVQELLGATLGRGSASFGPAMIVDGDIREGTGTSPYLAMSSTGQADVVYRVVQETNEGQRTSIPLRSPGDVVEQVRVAHFNGERWIGLGAINRNAGISMRAPTEANAPRIAIGPTGNAIVVWQEPDNENVARIWARRIFRQSVNYVMPVTAATFNGAPITADADAPSVAFSRTGQAEVAYRQVAGAGSPLPGPRIFLNILPDGESENGASFSGAKVADSQVPGGAGAAIGRPSIDIDEKQDLRLLYDSGGTPRVVEGNDRGLAGTLTLGPPFVGSQLSPATELPSASVMNPAGGGVSAWASEDRHGRNAVAVREDFPSGAVQTALVAGGSGGPIGDLAVGRSGLGDGLVAFQQGPLGNAAILAAQVTAPPVSFAITVPRGWVKPAAAEVRWEAATSANGPLTYAVTLDGRRLPTPHGVFSVRIDPRGLGDGTHPVQVLATDIYGQSTLSAISPLHVAGRAPAVTVAVQGRSVVVRVSDRYAGLNVHRVSVTFGDGQGGSGRKAFRHRFAHAGLYSIVVRSADKLGNAGVVHRVVSVR